MYYIFIHSVIHGDLGSFSILAIVNNAAVNRDACIFWINVFVFFGEILRSEIAESFPCVSAGKEYVCNVGDLGWIPGLGRSPAEGKGYPLQYSGLENSMDCIVHRVTKSQTGLNDLHSLTHCLYPRLLWGPKVTEDRDQFWVQDFGCSQYIPGLSTTPNT